MKSISVAFGGGGGGGGFEGRSGRGARGARDVLAGGKPKEEAVSGRVGEPVRSTGGS